jgi:DNA-binding response OmpR family regulator
MKIENRKSKMRRVLLEAFVGTSKAFSPVTSLQGIRVLLVDDDPFLLDGLTQRLQRWGCRVRQSRDVDGALEELDATVDVAVLDWMLIGGTCEPIVERIHHDGLPCGVILFSGVATAEPAMVLAQYREVAFLRKPCGTKGLLLRIWLASAVAAARRDSFTADAFADAAQLPPNVDRGELLFNVVEGALQRAGNLTPRVLQALGRYLRGGEMKAIARIMGIEFSTVRNMIKAARDRCGAESNEEFLRIAAAQLSCEWQRETNRRADEDT